MRGTEWRALSRFGLKMARVALARPEAAARCVSAAVPGALHRPCAVARAGAACRAGWGWGGAVHCRGMAMTDAAINASMNTVNDMFVEARELIADALDSQGSTYFEDDLKVPCSPRRLHRPPPRAHARRPTPVSSPISARQAAAQGQATTAGWRARASCAAVWQQCSSVAWLHGHTRECKMVEQCAKMSRVPCGRMRRTWYVQQ